MAEVRRVATEVRRVAGKVLCDAREVLYIATQVGRVVGEVERVVMATTRVVEDVMQQGSVASGASKDRRPAPAGTGSGPRWLVNFARA